METIADSYSDILSKQYNTKVITKCGLAISLFIAAIILTVNFHPDSASGVYLGVVTLSILGIIFFIIKIISGSKNMVYTPSGSRIKNYSLFFKNEDYDKLVKSFGSGNINSLYNISSGGNSGLRVDIIVSDDGKFAVCQIFKYIPYNYEPASEIYSIKESDIAMLNECIKKHS